MRRRIDAARVRVAAIPAGRPTSSSPFGTEVPPMVGTARSSVWGEGFVDDGWTDMAAVDDWARVEPDEYVRFFPRLIPRDGRLPDVLRDYLGGVAVGGVGLMGQGGSSDHARTAGVRANGIVDDDPAPSADDNAAGIRFAFLTGVHPAYVWPSAALAPERGSTAGWLGLIDRGRPALMPADVATYLLDVIECRQGRPVSVRDPQIAALFGAGIDLDQIWRAARDRQLGRSTVVRRSRHHFTAHPPWSLAQAVADFGRRVAAVGRRSTRRA